MSSSSPAAPTLHPSAQALNERLAAAAPAVADALSPLARAAFYPRDIPFQAAQAAGASFNATIGQITDGAGGILSVDAIRDAVALDPVARNRGLLYSPVGGQPELRRAWNEYQTPEALRGDGGLPCGPPVVAVGLTHAIALAADLFAGPGRDVVIPDPCWGNYVQVFGLRGGARIHRAPTYDEGRWSWGGLRRTLDGLDGDAPVVVVLNLPSNPGGYSPTDEERRELVDLLVEAAGRRTVVVLCDDAYAGLVFEEGIRSESVFWDLLGAHERLIPLRGGGSTKEFLFFGGRVGFLTLPFAEESEAFRVLEDKLLSLVRSSVGSPVSLSQMLLLEALRDGRTAAQVEAVRATLGSRYRAMKEALAAASDAGGRFRVLPCNSGAFMLLDLGAGASPEAVRRRLLDEFDTGVVAIEPRYLRLAFCSVAEEAIPGLVERVSSALG